MIIVDIFGDNCQMYSRDLITFCTELNIQNTQNKDIGNALIEGGIIGSIVFVGLAFLGYIIRENQ